MVVATLNGLTSTLRSLNLDDPSRIARHLAIILTEQVYQALNGTTKVKTSEPLPEPLKGEHWDPNCTLLALASRLSPHPLRAWLDVAVGQGIVDDEEADAMEKRLRQRFAPFGSAPRVFEQVIASPFTPIDKLAPLPGADGDGAQKSARIPQVCSASIVLPVLGEVDMFAQSSAARIINAARSEATSHASAAPITAGLARAWPNLYQKEFIAERRTASSPRPSAAIKAAIQRRASVDVSKWRPNPSPNP